MEANMRSKSSLLTISIVLFLGICMFLFYYKFPTEVDVDRTAVSFVDNDPSSTIQTSVNIKGTLYRPVFRQAKFVGKVSIDGYGFTKEDAMMDIFITLKKNGLNMGNLTYISNKSPFSPNEGGLIWFDDNFENINIWGSSKWNKSKVGKHLFIVAESQNYEEAISIQRRMRNKFGEVFVPHN
jgi:hypothetical protein